MNYAGVTNGILNATSNVYDQSAIFNSFSLIGLTASFYDASALTLARTGELPPEFAQPSPGVRFL